MFPQHPLSAEERRLARLYRSLGPSDRDALLAFGEFLVQRAKPSRLQTEPLDPVAVTRPADESVVAAIKRLRRVYPMLDHGDLLHEASSLMSAHVLQGRSAIEVIDELEALFARHYGAYRDTLDRSPGG
jgi:hypothetical protein